MIRYLQVVVSRPLAITPVPIHRMLVVLVLKIFEHNSAKGHSCDEDYDQW